MATHSFSLSAFQWLLERVPISNCLGSGSKWLLGFPFTTVGIIMASISCGIERVTDSFPPRNKQTGYQR